MRGALALLALLAAACAQTPAPAPSLAGTHWMRVDRGEDAPHFPTLDFETARASGHAGCNRWFASVSAEGEQVTFGDIGATRMMCPPPAMATERAFFDALNRTHSARVENGRLVLRDAAGAALAQFDRAD